MRYDYCPSPHDDNNVGAYEDDDIVNISESHVSEEAEDIMNMTVQELNEYVLYLQKKFG